MVLHSSHGTAKPPPLVIQGGDPLLYELYRSVGAAAVCPDITIANTIGRRIWTTASA